MTQSPPPPEPRGRFAGLDGLRAVAVVFVVVYHFFPHGMLRSGLVGVDVFFVISGFLITSLLLREKAATGRIALTRFWTRRARRLLPALCLLVTVTATWAWMVGGDVLVHVGRQVLGAAVFGYNWVAVAGGSDYFSADAPELFRNLWSLAVEEQFYVLWPLLLPVLLLIRPRGARAIAVLLGAAASTVWMARIVAGGGDLTRAYFGTDSHAFGLLLGAALALGVERMLAAPPQWTRTRAARGGAAVLGSAGVAGLVAVAALPAVAFPGTLAAASVATAVVIVAAAVPGSRVGTVLDVAPLRWIGDRSYGIYLWHWPVLVLLTAAARVRGDEIPVRVGLWAALITLVCAYGSYRWVEQPVRRHGLVGTLRMFGARLAGAPGTRLSALATLAVAVVVVGGTTAAIATAPSQTSGQAAVAAGERALDAAADARPPLRADNVAPTRAKAPATVSGHDIDAIGDSVMLASAAALVDAYPGIRIDAAVSRSMWAAPGIVDQLKRDGALRPYVVVGLGTNGAVDPALLDRVTRALGPERRLVLVTAYAPRSWIGGVNARLREYARAHPDVLLADWAHAIAGHDDLLAEDDIHPGASGGRFYAAAIVNAIAADQRARAQAHERLLLRVAELAAVHPDM